MQFLADPSQLRLRPIAWLFLFVICILLPAGAMRQYARLATGTAPPTRNMIYASAMATHAMFLVLVGAVLWEQRLNFLPPYRATPWHVVVGVVGLAIGLLPMLERFRIKDPIVQQRVRLIAPRTPREFLAFYMLALTAGVAEELTYRGLLFTLLAALLASWWSAAVVAAAVFGIVHLFQGWKSAGIAALMGLREQIVVGLTGTLVIAIAVHFLHDAVVGTVVSLRARREEAAAAT